MRTQVWSGEEAHEEIVESAWERQMSLSGFEAYEKHRFKKNGKAVDASTTAAGQKTMRKFIEVASKAIEEAQQKLTHDRRKSRSLRGTVMMIPSDTAALITLRALIDRTYGAEDQDLGSNYQSLANEIAKAVELELNFNNWMKESRREAREYAKSQGWRAAPKSMAERLIEERGLSRKHLMFWRRTFEDLKHYQWDTEEKHYCGEFMVKTVADALSDVFEIHAPAQRGKTAKMVRMTSEYRTKFEEIEHKVARMQVVKKPMLARPRKWTKGPVE